MDSIDISDLAFSLSNLSEVNEALNSSAENITSLVSETIPEFVSETIPEFVSETIPEFVSETIPDIKEIDNNLLYLGIGLLLAVLFGFFIYNYYKNKNKHVHFQDNIENVQNNYQKQVNNDFISDF
jgi:uncharacterized membrane protein YukC